MGDTELISMDEAARIAGVSFATVYDWVATGRLTATARLGKRHVYRSELADLITPASVARPHYPSPDHFSTAQVAQRLGVSRRAVRYMIARGDLPAERIGHAFRVPRTAVTGRTPVAP